MSLEAAGADPTRKNLLCLWRLAPISFSLHVLLRTPFFRTTLFRMVCLLVMFTWCTVQVSADETLKVGVTLPLSGLAAEYGHAVRNGIELAVTTNPEQFARIRFVFEDNQYDGKRAISAYQKLRLTDRVKVIFAWGEVPSLTVAPLAERDGFPLVMLSTDPEPVKTFKHTLRFINAQGEYAERLVTYLRQQGVKKIGIVMVDDPYYTAYLDALRRYLRPDESIKVIANHLPGDTDFKPSILKARTEQFENVGVFLYVGQISAFYRQASALGYKPRTFGGDDFESKTEIAESRGGMDGAVFALNNVSKDFASRYRERYRSDTHLTYAANAYEFAYLMALVSRSKAPETGAELISQIEALQLPAGALGAAEFRASDTGGRYVRFPVVIKRVAGGAVEVVSE
jgi:branched-chain amino acid transport system substrate-binding protein